MTSNLKEAEQDSKKFNLFSSIEADLQSLETYLVNQLPGECGPLSSAVKFVMESGGKRLRPALAIVSGYLSSKEGKINEKHFVLAQLTELIHSASLVHDDLIDEAAVRRGKETCHLKWGSKLSVIIGDFLFAQASVKLGKLGNTEVVKIYAKVLADLCTGEVAQAWQRFDLSTVNWDNYIQKSISKTASLFAAATRSAGILNNLSEEEVESLTNYGQNLGIAFQIIDDLIDFTSTEADLGKPYMGDLKGGIFTAPVLYALENLKFASPLKELIQKRFAEENDLKIAKAIIEECGALEQTHKLAENYILKAEEELKKFPDSIYKSDLLTLNKFVLVRKF